MRFMIEEQYPEEWISEDEAVAPFPGCERVVGGYREGNEVVDHYIEVGSLEDLLGLGRRKRMNLFIDVKGMRIVLTRQIDL